MCYFIFFLKFALFSHHKIVWYFSIQIIPSFFFLFMHLSIFFFPMSGVFSLHIYIFSTFSSFFPLYALQIFYCKNPVFSFTNSFQVCNISWSREGKEKLKTLKKLPARDCPVSCLSFSLPLTLPLPLPSLFPSLPQRWT